MLERPVMVSVMRTAKLAAVNRPSVTVQGVRGQGLLEGWYIASKLVASTLVKVTFVRLML